MKHIKIKTLLGDNFNKLQNANILLLGVGGVGGFCLDCLYRSGIENITIVDFDSFDISNQNRQLYSELHVDELKTESLQQHYPNISIINTKITTQWVEEFDFTPFDMILDAIDDSKVKVALAQKCYEKLISSFGSANRLDPTKIKIDYLWKTKGDKLGAKIRYELRKEGFNKDYKVIYSTEELHSKEMGSFVGVTASFGLLMCSETLKTIIKKKNKNV